MQGCWTGKIQWFTASRNRNNRSNGSVFVSNIGVDNKEATHPDYWMNNCDSSDGILTGLSDMVFKRRTMASAVAGSYHGYGKIWELAQRDINKNDITKVTPIFVYPHIFYFTPVIFSCFVCDLLSFFASKFTEKCENNWTFNFDRTFVDDNNYSKIRIM